MQDLLPAPASLKRAELIGTIKACIAEREAFVAANPGHEDVRGAEQNKWDCKINPDRDCSPEYVADLANKFAAAPALYEALKSSVASWRSLCDANGWEPDHLAWYDQARAALAQADGEQA